LSKIRSRLHALSAPELEAFATENLPAGTLADALGIQSASPPASPAPPALSSPQFPRWVRFELALGLELHVRDDASAAVIELARRLREVGVAGT
jgi:hypothetical protein